MKSKPYGKVLFRAVFKRILEMFKVRKGWVEIPLFLETYK